MDITGALWGMVIFGTPFIAFIVGVAISTHLKLHGSISAKHVWLMAIPVGLLTTGNLLMVTTITIEDANVNEVITKYGHMNSVGQFLVFVGTLMLYGTLVPQLFGEARERLLEQMRHPRDEDGSPPSAVP